MALDVPVIFEIRQTGADTNAGAFTLGASIAAPAAPSVSNAGSGGTVAASTYYCVITYTDALGDTVISGQTSTTTSGTTSTITVTSPAAATGAKTWNCYFGTTSGGPYFPQGTTLAIGSNRVVTTTPPTTGTQPKGVDYSQQDSPQINVADGVANGTTTFTSATAGFTGAHVGNLIRVGTTTWRRIVGVTNATTVVLDATVSTNTGLPVVVGGAFATPGMIGAASPISNSIGFLKYSVTIYTLSATPNVSGGKLSIGPDGFALVGYDVTRTIGNADANRPTLKPTANSMVCIALTNTGGLINNIAITNPDNRTSVTAFTNAQGSMVRCKVNGCQLVESGSQYMNFVFCDFSVTQTIGTSSFWYFLFCDIHDGGGISLDNLFCKVHGCNIYNITASPSGINLNGANCLVSNNNIYNVSPASQTSYGILHVSSRNCVIINNVIENVNPSGQPGYALGSLSNPVSSNFFNNFYYNVKTDAINPANMSIMNNNGLTQLSASPFTAPGSGNFAPNNTAGGGAVIRAASLPTTFPAGTTLNKLDAGAVQHLGIIAMLVHLAGGGGGFSG